MRGAFVFVALALGLATPSSASTVEAVVRQKAAAVSIFRTKARKYAATLAQGRLFNAWLNASTQSEGERLRSRIGLAFKALESHYGMHDFTVVDRSGDLFLHVGKTDAPAAKRNLKTDPILAAGFAQNERQVASVMEKDSVTYVSPVTHQGEKEFVLSIQQDLSAYDKVLSLGLAKPFYVLVVDAKGTVLSDSRGPARKPFTANLSLDALRKDLGGSATEGTGIVINNGALFNISYQTAGEWTVVAIEPVQTPSTCLRTGERQCQ